MSFSAGRLRQRIRIQQKGSVDAVGRSISYSTLADVRAHISRNIGGEKAIDTGLAQADTAIITIRYSATVSVIDNTMRILDRDTNEVYEVESVNRLMSEDRFLQIRARVLSVGQ